MTSFTVGGLNNMNPFTKSANLFRLLSKAVRGQVPLKKALPLAARYSTGIKPGQTWTGQLKQKPLRTAWNTALAPAPAIPHGKKLMFGGTAAAFGDDAYRVGKELSGLDDIARGALQEQFGDNYDENSYRAVRWELIKRSLLGMADKLGLPSFVDNAKKLITGLGVAEKTTPEKLKREAYKRLITNSILPKYRQKLNKGLDAGNLNPYNETMGNKRYLLHPTMLEARNVAGRYGATATDSLLNRIGVPEKPVVNPFVGPSDVADAGKYSDSIRAAFAQDVGSILEKHGPDSLKPTFGYINEHTPALMKYLTGKGLLKNPNLSDLAGAASTTGIVGATSGAPDQDVFYRNQKLGESLKALYPNAKSNFSSGYNFMGNYQIGNQVNIGAPQSVGSPGVYSHEIGHSIGGRARPSLVNKVYKGSRIGNLVSPQIRADRFGIAEKLFGDIAKPESDTALSMNTAHAALATPMVAHETEDSVRGAAHAYNTFNNDPNVSKLDLGKTMGGAFTGLPTYYNSAYGPLWESLEARGKQRETQQKTTLR